MVSGWLGQLEPVGVLKAPKQGMKKKKKASIFVWNNLPF